MAVEGYHGVYILHTDSQVRNLSIQWASHSIRINNETSRSSDADAR